MKLQKFYIEGVFLSKSKEDLMLTPSREMEKKQFYVIKYLKEYTVSIFSIRNTFQSANNTIKSKFLFVPSSDVCGLKE